MTACMLRKIRLEDMVRVSFDALKKVFVSRLPAVPICSLQKLRNFA